MRIELRVPGDERLAEREYVLGVVLNDFLGLRAQLVTRTSETAGVELRIAGEEGRVVLADVLFSQPSERWLEPASLPAEPLATISREKAGAMADVAAGLPVIYGAPLADGSWMAAREGRTVEVGLDVLGSIFFMLTRYEEVVASDVDDYGRFPAASSLAHRYGFLRQPIVELYLSLLEAALRAAFPGFESRRASAYSPVISHDVDHPWSLRPQSLPALGRTLAVDLLARRAPALALDRAAAFFAKRELSRDPYDTFRYLMDSSERLGVRSSFYFIPDAPGRTDAEYRLDDPRAQALMRLIAERGHEVGYHASFDAAYVENQVVDEVSHLRAAKIAATGDGELRGGRHHYLRWRPGVSWEQWDAAGLDYDSSVGFASHVGFRAGTTRPYRTFSLRERRPLGLTELPLLVMDGTLFAPQYMNLSDVATLEVCQELFRSCREHGIPATLLWHNSYLDRPRLARMHAAITALL